MVRSDGTALTIHGICLMAFLTSFHPFPFNRFVGLVEQPLNVGPVLLNQMTKALLLLDFF